jgi:hypothetical protein
LLSVEDEGFEMTRPKAVDGITKSRTIPFKLSTKDLEKNPFSKPYEGLFDRAPGILHRENLGKNCGVLGGTATQRLPAAKLAGGGRGTGIEPSPRGST